MLVKNILSTEIAFLLMTIYFCQCSTRFDQQLHCVTKELGYNFTNETIRVRCSCSPQLATMRNLSLLNKFFQSIPSYEQVKVKHV